MRGFHRKPKWEAGADIYQGWHFGLRGGSVGDESAVFQRMFFVIDGNVGFWGDGRWYL